MGGTGARPLGLSEKSLCGMGPRARHFTSFWEKNLGRVEGTKLSTFGKKKKKADTSEFFFGKKKSG